MNLKIVMVEGPHDGAFISKVMQVNGYSTFSKPINEFQPLMMAEYLKGQYKNASVGGLNLQSVRQQILFPSYALVSGEEIMLIFHMGGDNRADRRARLVKDLRDFFLSPASRSTGIVMGDDTLTFIFEFDADEIGVNERLKQASTEIGKLDSGFRGFQNNASYEVSNGLRWGVYVFAKNDGKGRLEDIILPMMEKDNEDIAKCAKDYVDKRTAFSLFQKEKPTKHPEKARIGVMGQLQKAGSAIPAIIEQSAYLTDEKIKKSTICMDVFNFMAK